MQYIASWLSGKGCVPINDLMEDAATTEICRSQLWQWIRNDILCKEGIRINNNLIKTLISESYNDLLIKFNNKDNLIKAKEILLSITTNSEFEEFFTTVAYKELN